MANVKAIKTGNWSDPTVWDNGALPTSADDVYANGFTVTINMTVTVLSIRTQSAPGINAGGGFQYTLGGFVFTGNIIAGTTTCLSYTAAAIATSNINGDISGGSSSSAHGVSYVAATGIINIVGNIFATNGPAAHGLNCTVICTINITGNITGGSNSGSAINTNVSCIVNITGNITAANGTITTVAVVSGNLVVTGNIIGGSANGASGISLTGGGSVTINGNVTGGSFSTGQGVVNTSAGTIVILGNAIGGTLAIGAVNSGPGTMRVNIAIASATMAGLHGSLNSGTTVFKSMQFASNGCVPVTGFVRLDNAITSNIRARRENNTDIVLIDAANLANELPAPANVRAGTVYNSGNRVGTLAVPEPENVRRGIATDNTLGTADLTRDDFWNAPLAGLNTGIGARLKDVSTVQTTGDQLAALL